MQKSQYKSKYLHVTTWACKSAKLYRHLVIENKSATLSRPFVTKRNQLYVIWILVKELGTKRTKIPLHWDWWKSWIHDLADSKQTLNYYVCVLDPTARKHVIIIVLCVKQAPTSFSSYKTKLSIQNYLFENKQILENYKLYNPAYCEMGAGPCQSPCQTYDREELRNKR